MPDKRQPRFLIQRQGTGFFFKDPDGWVQDRTKATDYGSTSNALETSRRLDFKDVRFVIDFGDPQLDVYLEMPSPL